MRVPWPILAGNIGAGVGKGRRGQPQRLHRRKSRSDSTYRSDLGEELATTESHLLSRYFEGIIFSFH